MLIKDATLKDLIIGRKVLFLEPNKYAVIVGLNMERPPEKEFGQTGPRFTEVDFWFLESKRVSKGTFLIWCKNVELLDEYFTEDELYEYYK